MTRPFRDRSEAGRLLAEKLSAYEAQSNVLVLALPRGGVPVGFEVARALGAPLDALIVRKLGVPGHRELAMGAIVSDGTYVLNYDVIESLGISKQTIIRVACLEQQELGRRETLYRDDRPWPVVRGRTVILVDDGLATGSTMKAAIASVRAHGPARIVVAVPTAAPSTCEEFRHLADECCCLITPDPFLAVGVWYEDFSQTTDQEVRQLLEQASGGNVAGRQTSGERT